MVLAALAVSGCAMAPRATTVYRSETRAPAQPEASVAAQQPLASTPPMPVRVNEALPSPPPRPAGARPASAPPSETAAAPVSPAPAAAGTSVGGAIAPDDGVSAEAQIRRYEAQIAAARATIAADPATCRDVCGATTTLCRAAGELCRLTGDPDDHEARDPRCRRARVACADASRQRDGACPLCPTPR